MYQLFEGENIPVIQNFNIPLPLGKHQAFDYHLYLGSTQEFDLCLGGVRNLNQKCQVSLCLLSDRNKILYTCDLSHSEIKEGKNTAFVNEWFIRQGLQARQACNIFQVMYENESVFNVVIILNMTPRQALLSSWLCQAISCSPPGENFRKFDFNISCKVIKLLTKNYF